MFIFADMFSCDVGGFMTDMCHGHVMVMSAKLIFQALTTWSVQVRCPRVLDGASHCQWPCAQCGVWRALAAEGDSGEPHRHESPARLRSVVLGGAHLKGHGPQDRRKRFGQCVDRHLVSEWCGAFVLVDGHQTSSTLCSLKGFGLSLFFEDL